MSVINIQRRHQFSLNNLRAKIDVIRTSFEEDFGFRTEWVADDQLLFRKKGIKGEIGIGTDSFQITINLSLMYRSVAEKIKHEVTTTIDYELQSSTEPLDRMIYKSC